MDRLEDIETEIERLEEQIHNYGAFDDVSDELLNEYRELLDRRDDLNFQIEWEED